MTNKASLWLLMLMSATLLYGCGKSETSAAGGGAGGSSSGMAQTVQAKIKADKSLAGADIKVTEQNGTIVLDGTAANQAQKDEAEKIVYDTEKEKNAPPGVMDNLMVKEGGAPAGGGQ